jgi:hypothetical protein
LKCGPDVIVFGAKKKWRLRIEENQFADLDKKMVDLLRASISRHCELALVE